MRTVRNFWINVDVDGRQNQIGSGPSRADGGMRGSIKMRNDGNVLDAIRFHCRVTKDGDLVLEVYPASTDAKMLVEHREDQYDGHVLTITTKR